jgi:hypothetical protein
METPASSIAFSRSHTLTNDNLFPTTMVQEKKEDNKKKKKKIRIVTCLLQKSMSRKYSQQKTRAPKLTRHPHVLTRHPHPPHTTVKAKA